MHVVKFVAFAACNVILYGLLSDHHHEMCHRSWWSKWLLRESAYCRAVRWGLDALQIAPLAAVGLMRPNAAFPIV